MRVLIDGAEGSDAESTDTDDEEDDEEDSEMESSEDAEATESEEGEDQTLYRATWDSADQVYRCTECAYEVVDGVCQNKDCFAEFDCDGVRFLFLLILHLFCYSCEASRTVMNM
jgi:rubrerythrin